MAIGVFLAALAVLLAGYMFLGRGFAHLGRPPVYVGEVVLLTGLVATGIALVRSRFRFSPSAIAWALLAFMGLGLIRTVPYLAEYRVDALRDGVLWGYAAFALMIYVVADKALPLRAMRLYGWVLPVFALWLPIAFNLFVVLSSSIDPDERGSNVPLVFFKSGDMAVHVVGAIAFLVLVAPPITTKRVFLWRSAIVLPLLWTAFVAGATNRGGLVSVVIGLIAVAALTTRRPNWMPVLVAPAVLATVFVGAGFLEDLAATARMPDIGASPTPVPIAIASSSPADPDGSAERAIPSRSLVTNPGFEVGTTNSASIRGWELIEGSSNIVAGGHGGANFALLQSAAAPNIAAIRSNEFSIQAGDELSVSLMARAVAGSPTIEVYVEWYDSSGSRISREVLSALATGGLTAWQECSGVLTAPPSATHAQILLRETTGGAAIGIDEVIVAAVVPRSLVSNSGFEFGPPHGHSISGWEILAGSGTITEGGYRGDNLASMQSGDDPYTAAIGSAQFAVQSGLDLSVSLRVKAIVGSPRIEVSVNWYDRSKTLISTVASNAVSTDGGTNWQESTRIVTVPPNATHAQLVLWEAAGGRATVGIDEVIVEAGDFVESPPIAEGRPATIGQIVENITSIFTDVPDEGLEGTERFRIRWWTAIVQYTVFGEHFWTGKGFGINLADVDGFQANEDRSLRAPHNSHITVLARMGIPGFALWVLLQGALAAGLVRSVMANRRAADTRLAAVGAWILAYWIAMMVNTSFDPYLEGPQGGIWFWSLFGLGMVVMRLTPTHAQA